MADGDIIRLRIHTQSGPGHIIESAIGFISITDDVLWYENVVDEWMEHISSLWMAKLSHLSKLENVSIQWVKPSTGPAFVFHPSPAIFGGDPGAELPLHTAGVLSWRTPIKGRSGRGRVLIGCLPTSAIGNSQALHLDWQDWLLEIGGESLGVWGDGGLSDQARLCVVATTFGGIPLPSPIGINVDDLKVNPNYGTVRRRVIASA